MDFTLPDRGIVAALQLNNLPITGTAVEFGFGNGRNIGHIAQQKPLWSCIGYETDPFWLDLATCGQLLQVGSAQVIYDNALKVVESPQEYCLAIAGMIMYNPKSIVREFISNLWPQIMVGGILHLQIATLDDGCINDEFITFACFPDGIDPHSYIYERPFYSTAHEGVQGGSFWSLREVKDLIQRCPHHTVVFAEKVDFAITDEDGGTKHRSYYNVTIQKCR